MAIEISNKDESSYEIQLASEISSNQEAMEWIQEKVKNDIELYEWNSTYTEKENDQKTEEIRDSLSDNAKEYYDEIKDKKFTSLLGLLKRGESLSNKQSAIIEIAQKEWWLDFIIRVCNDKNYQKENKKWWEDINLSLSRSKIWDYNRYNIDSHLTDEERESIKGKIRQYDTKIDLSERGIYFLDEKMEKKETIILKHLQEIAWEIQDKIESTEKMTDRKSIRKDLEITYENWIYYLESYWIKTALIENPSNQDVWYKSDEWKDYYSREITSWDKIIKCENENHAIWIANLINYSLHKAQELKSSISWDNPFYVSYSDNLKLIIEWSVLRWDLDLIENINTVWPRIRLPSSKKELGEVLNDRFSRL